MIHINISRFSAKISRPTVLELIALAIILLGVVYVLSRPVLLAKTFLGF